MCEAALWALQAVPSVLAGVVVVEIGARHLIHLRYHDNTVNLPYSQLQYKCNTVCGNWHGTGVPPAREPGAHGGDTQPPCPCMHEQHVCFVSTHTDMTDYPGEVVLECDCACILSCATCSNSHTVAYLQTCQYTSALRSLFPPLWGAKPRCTCRGSNTPSVHNKSCRLTWNL
jgi:hypothetical protein